VRRPRQIRVKVQSQNLQMWKRHIKERYHITDMTSSASMQSDAELMFELLDFARCHGRKILETQTDLLEGEKNAVAFQKLLIGEYLEKVEKKDIPAFYSLTSKGLNLFHERLDSPVTEEAHAQIVQTLAEAMVELEIKPWEVMFHIIHVIGRKRGVTTGDIEDYFSTSFPDIKGTSRANIYRNIKHLRMKGYIEYSKRSNVDQNQYSLSKKGEEIFYMTHTDATHRLRTVEEWDNTLREVLERVRTERKEDDSALFFTMERSIPEDLDTLQVAWILYSQGTIYELKGNLDKAEEVYVRMEGICEERSDTRGKAYALKGLGNVSFRKERYRIANQYYSRALNLAQAIGDHPLLSDVLNNLGSCLYMNDDIDEALLLLEKALTLREADTYRKASTLYNEGLCYARKEDLDKAKILWERSLALYRELQETGEIHKVEYNLRQVDKKQKKDHLEEGYRRAQQTGTTQDIRKAYKELADFQMDDFLSSTG
jgi:tetratricopeptide (TPR) repeat protein